MIFASLAALSLTSLAFELAVTRYFSIAHWSHLSFLAVGVAMFGYGAGGIVHSAAERFIRRVALRDEPALFGGLCAAGSFSTVGSFLLLKAIPLDYLRLPIEPAQAVYLVLTWLVLSLPFFVAGLASCAAYALRPRASGALSGAAMAGAALGVAAPLVLLPLLGEGGSIAAAAAAPLVAIVVVPGDRSRRTAAAVLAAGLLVTAAWQARGVFDVEPSPYKTLPQLAQAPGTLIGSMSTDIRARLEEVDSPALRFAPGLSLSYQGALPGQTAIAADGDSLSVFYDLDSPGSEGFSRWTHPYSPQVLVERAAASLVIQADGGLALACAVAGGASRITLVVENPRIADRAARAYAGREVSVVADSPRAFAARGGPGFDTIAVEEWGPTIPGMASLNESALFTREAIRAYWRMLTARGALAIPRRLVLPPSDSLRLFATCLDALAAEGVAGPAGHLAVIRSWDSCTLLVSRPALSGDALDRLREFAGSRGFDLDYYPGMPLEEAGRFNLYERPVFAEAYLAIVRDGDFPSRYVLDIAPQGDDRPFPSHFIRWTRLGEFFRITGQRAYTLFLSGEVVAGATLLAALVTGAILASLTLASMASRPGGRGGGAGLFCLIAASMGLGFMFAEMFVIDSLGLVFPAPSVALTIALGGLLASSALGALASERLSLSTLRWVLPGIALALAVCAFLLPPAAGWAATLPPLSRIVVSLGAAAVPGFLVGAPFPALMRILGCSAGRRAAGWALNGCGSALASVSSALIAPAAGMRLLLFLAAAAYAVAAAAAGRRTMDPRPVFKARRERHTPVHECKKSSRSVP